MKRDWSRFAPLGLVFAGLAAFVAFCLYIIVPKWSLWVQISLLGVLVGLVVYVALAPGQLRRAIQGRRMRYGLNAVLMSLAFLGIVVVINYLVYYNAKMNPKQTRWDLTEDQSNTLAPETLDALSKLPDVVHAQAFYSPVNTSINTAKDLLDNYAKNSKGKFVYEFIDWEKKPTLAQQAGITNDGQIVLNMGDRKELISVVSEQEITSGLIRLISNEKRVVYFLQDEGEYDPNGTGTDAASRGMSRVRDALEAKNYTVKTLKLAVDGQVPQDAQIIVIAGPTQPLSQASTDLLAGYLQKGGSLILLEGPMIDNSGNFLASDPLADYLTKTWGITLGDNVVITLSANQPSLTAMAAAYSNHLITQKMGAYTPSFPLARSVTVQSQTGLNEQELVYTTQNYSNCFPACSWATTNIPGLVAWANGTQAQPPQSSSDMMGPIPIAAAAENTTTTARVVVFGSSDFASNAYRTPGNQDLLLNAIDWGAKQEQLINLTPKATKDRTFVASVLKYPGITTNLIFLGSIVVLPGAVLFAGVFAWVVRRKRG